MKTAVCILIVLLSAVIGNGFRTDIKRRCESLEALRQVCIKMQNEISFRAPPITELITRCSADSPCSALFSQAKEKISEGFALAWHDSAEKWSSRIGLTQDERETVLLLESLGGSDTEGEKRLLSTVADRLSEHTENIKNELNTKGKMLFSCSMLAGIAFVILII